MDILVCGETGFIGRSLLKRFSKMGYELWACEVWVRLYFAFLADPLLISYRQHEEL